MTKVRFLGGPFDQKTACQPTEEDIWVHVRSLKDAVERAHYIFDGVNFVFYGLDMVYELIGGPMDGYTVPYDPALPDDDSLVVPLNTGKYAWYKPAGGGRFLFDGCSDEADLEPIKKE